MAYTLVGDAIPDRLVVGESVSWKWADSRFPASDGWELTYTLVNADGQIQITASADGDDHLVEVASTTTADYTAGEYDWQAHISDGTERYKVAEGVIEIVPDFAEETAGYDARSHAKIMLDALEATLEGRATKTQMRQEIGGVRVEHMTHDQLIKARAYYASKYRQELVAAGKVASRRQIKARFSSWGSA